MTPNHERVKGWLGVLLPMAERAGPVLSLVLALMAALAVWYLLGVLRENRALTLELFNKLLACQDAKVELARQCGHQ